MALGHALELPREVRKPGRRHSEAAERIVVVRVEPGRDQQQVRAEAIEHGHGHGAKHLVEIGVAGARLERQVHGETGPRAAPDLVGRAGARVVRELMRRDEQDRRFLVEGRLRAVAG
jgi:hypothetical protein